MKENVFIKTIINEVGNNRVEYISGTFKNVGTQNCSLSKERGCVYGIAVKIENEADVKIIFDGINKENKAILKIEEWEPIAESKFYPLYWGKDINMGFRLYSHTKSSKTTSSIQLDSLSILKNHEVVYCAVQCLNKEKIEKKLKRKYKCLLKTLKTK